MAVLEIFQREVERAREEELEEEEEPWVVAQSEAGVCLEIDELTEELFYDKRVAEGGQYC